MALPRRLALRSVLALGAAAPILAAAAPRAHAATAHYPMACDPTLLTALRSASDMFRSRTDILVHVLPTSPALLVPQMTHQIQNDIIMAREDIAAAVVAAGYAAPGAPRPRFRSRLVLATRADAPSDAIRTGPFAVTDPTPDTPRDDIAILDAMGIRAAHTMGAVDSGGVAFLVESGAAMAGLMLMSDVRANPALKPVIPAPDSVPPLVFVAALTRAPVRPQPEAFVTYLASNEGAAILARFGVEKIT